MWSAPGSLNVTSHLENSIDIFISMCVIGHPIPPCSLYGMYCSQSAVIKPPAKSCEPGSAEAKVDNACHED